MLFGEGAQEAGVDDLIVVIVIVTGLVPVKRGKVVQDIKANETLVHGFIDLALTASFCLHI